MTHSEQINELVAAMAKAQAEIGPAEKNKVNPHFRSAYADLASVWDACRRALSANGLSVIQATAETDAGLVLVSLLAHTSGQWVKGVFPLRPLKDDPQSLGSVISYARRYALAALVGVCPEDDDGEAAVRRPARRDEPRGEARADRRPGPSSKPVKTWDQVLAGAVAYWDGFDPMPELPPERDRERTAREHRIAHDLITVACKVDATPDGPLMRESEVQGPNGKRVPAKVWEKVKDLYASDSKWVRQAIHAHLREEKAKAESPEPDVAN